MDDPVLLLTLLAGLLGAPADMKKPINTKDSLDKPASQETDIKSVVCLSALKILSRSEFRGLDGLWASCLLQMFGLFTDTLNGDVFFVPGLPPLRNISFPSSGSGNRFVGCLPWATIHLSSARHCENHASSTCGEA